MPCSFRSVTTTERSGESAIGGKERTDAVWRDVHRGRVWRAQACRIVEESPELIVLWMPSGTPTLLPMDDDGKRIRIPTERWTLEPVESWTRDAVTLTRPGRPHSIYVFWREGAFEHWYVNFEEPLRRTPVGYDTFDHKLDLIVMPDGTYRWKDEDELEQAAARGLLDPTRSAPRPSASWRSGRSRPAGRTGGPTRPGRSHSCPRDGTALG
jgi:hypothetical protein